MLNRYEWAITCITVLTSQFTKYRFKYVVCVESKGWGTCSKLKRCRSTSSDGIKRSARWLDGCHFRFFNGRRDDKSSAMSGHTPYSSQSVESARRKSKLPFVHVCRLRASYMSRSLSCRSSLRKTNSLQKRSPPLVPDGRPCTRLWGWDTSYRNSSIQYDIGRLIRIQNFTATFLL